MIPYPAPLSQASPPFPLSRREGRSWRGVTGWECREQARVLSLTPGPSPVERVTGWECREQTRVRWRTLHTITCRWKFATPWREFRHHVAARWMLHVPHICGQIDRWTWKQYPICVHLCPSVVRKIVSRRTPFGSRNRQAPCRAPHFLIFSFSDLPIALPLQAHRNASVNRS